MTNLNLDKIVISSRIRIARNVSGYNFPCSISKEKGEELRQNLFNIIDKIGNFTNYNLKNMQEFDYMALVENGVISSDLLLKKDIAGISICNDNSLSIMINEEDHLREQCVMKGFNLHSAYDKINNLDNKISEKIKFSYNENLGYLTSCPTNLGTGMRASVMMFLPALCKTNGILNVINTVSKLGICVRGANGENSNYNGCIFQVSNQITLGKTEVEIVDMVENAVNKICELENQARDMLLKNNKDSLYDEVLRAYGIISNCYKMDLDEFYNLFSLIKLGEDLGVITFKNNENLFDILNAIKPYNLMKKENQNLTDKECRIVRAELLNSYFKNLKV